MKSLFLYILSATIIGILVATFPSTTQASDEKLPAVLSCSSLQQLGPYFIGKSKPGGEAVWNLVSDPNGLKHLMKKTLSPFSCKKEASVMLKLQEATLPISALNSEEKFFLTGPFTADALPISLSDSKLKMKKQQFKSTATKMAKVIQKLQNAQILHLDLTLSNWVSQEGKIMLVEFGNAKSFSDHQPHKGYGPNMAPEIRTDPISYTAKSDIWGLGMAFYHLWTLLSLPDNLNPPVSFIAATKLNGKQLNQLDVESEYLEKNRLPICSWFPAPLKELVEKMTDSDPNNRPNVDSVLAELDSLILDVDATQIKLPTKSATPLPLASNTNKAFDRKCYSTLPLGISPAPLLQKVIESESLSKENGGNLQSARIVALGINDNELFTVKKCQNTFTCGKEIVFLTLLRGKNVTADIVAQNQEASLIAMENLQGESLKQIKGIPKEEFIPLATQMAQILQKVHQLNILHLNLGFGNWILEKSNNKVVLLDFGRARFMGDPTPHQGFVNTSAPETRNLQQVSPASDVWALGMGFYTLWTCIQKPMTVNTFQAAIRRNALDLREDPKAAQDTYFATSELPYGTFFPKSLIDLVLDITQHDALKRPSLELIITRLTELSL